ncbi:polyprenyl synthetase family protein [Streptomyces sp. CB00455]|uniref:polyprenyl synthetase family protein n=1 Tax=Streptomyces sp. CB00455 TaxID=1703927 RepID=UPI0009A0D352|nr:polyprenyl synthetase family protein [Streptomyces sp. CB00455]
MHAKSVARQPFGPPQLPRDHLTGSAAVDADVPAAVNAALQDALAERVGQCAELDPVFAADIAQRLASFTLSGGSRIRPQFLWWAMRACSDAERHTLPALHAAAALELIQSCALVHDDVMDRSAVRRGRPSLHTQIALQYPVAARTAPSAGPAFASSAAVLAGDLALSWADDLVAALDLTPSVRADVLRIWRDMRTEMVAGQYLDLHGEATASHSVVQAIRTVCLKTARYTVERPLALGAALAGADPVTVQALTAAGRCAGIAFQLRDDLLGAFGDPEVTGKPSGDDLRFGKPTYLLSVARARARALGNARISGLLDDVRGDVPLSEESLAAVREALVATGAPARVERRIARLVEESEHHLAAVGVTLLQPAAGRLAELMRRAAAPPDAAPAPTGPGTAERAGRRPEGRAGRSSARTPWAGETQ